MPKKKIFKLEKQLHEQYAINNNSNLSSIIALITTFLIVLGTYGYVFVNTSIELASDFGNLTYSSEDCCKYYLDVLILMTIVVYVILLIIYYVSAYLGTNQRKEQFINWAIRIKHFQTKKEYNDVFPDSYNPFGKHKGNFVQGMFNELMRIVKIIFWIVTIATGVKLTYFISKLCGQVIKCDNCILIVVYMMLIVIAPILFYFFKHSFYQEYKDRQSEYREKNIDFKD